MDTNGETLLLSVNEAPTANLSAPVSSETVINGFAAHAIPESVPVHPPAAPALAEPASISSNGPSSASVESRLDASGSRLALPVLGKRVRKFGSFLGSQNDKSVPTTPVSAPSTPFVVTPSTPVSTPGTPLNLGTPLSASGSWPGLPIPALSSKLARKEVIATPDDLRKVKLSKGYSYEPVPTAGVIIPKHEEAPLSAKRERKKSSVLADYDEFSRPAAANHDDDEFMPKVKKAKKESKSPALRDHKVKTPKSSSKSKGGYELSGVLPEFQPIPLPGHASSKKYKREDHSQQFMVPPPQQLSPTGPLNPLVASGPIPMTSQAVKQCKSILNACVRDPNADPFKVPVDPVKLGIPDYFNIIKFPMDLSTIRTKLDRGKYAHVEEFAADFRLIFSNCLAYNGAMAPVTLMSKKIEQIFESRFAEKLPMMRALAMPTPAIPAYPQYAPPSFQQYPYGYPMPPAAPPPPVVAPPPLLPPAPKSYMRETIQELTDSMKYVREEIQRLRKEAAERPPPPPPLPPPPLPVYEPPPLPEVVEYIPPPRQRGQPSGRGRGRPPTAPEPEKEMTFEEKRSLSLNINNLPPESLGKIVSIIHQRMPHLAGGSDEIEIDIDALDAGTLRALEKYVNGVLHKSQPRNKAQAKSAAANLSRGRQKPPRSSGNGDDEYVPDSLDTADVRRRLHDLSSSRSRNGAAHEAEEVIVDDIGHEQPSYPPVTIEKDASSSSDSDSSSSSSSSSDSSSSESASDGGPRRKRLRKKSKASPVNTAVLMAQQQPTPGSVLPTPPPSAGTKLGCCQTSKQGSKWTDTRFKCTRPPILSTPLCFAF
eukprot:TRINITY_DN2394_c0_g1_i4.p1 TRINITY_DN2394_c0_g1~~TRINITY_DN2394_c0_g1_i4.p1  ORF type:complete len:821 (+),score=117.22 TRINITY_DN2394_c0_g1_i4:115-2577(+)